MTSSLNSMVLRTFNIEIVMTEEVRRHWLNLLVQSRDAYNFCADTAVKEEVPLSLKAFHNALYQRMRDEFKELPAQAVIKVYKDVLAALRSIRGNKQRNAETPHREALSLQLDRHLYSRMSSEGIILSSDVERKRVLCPFKLYDKVRELFSTCPAKDPRIFYLGGRFFLSVPFECPTLPLQGENAVGVDLGMKRLFVTSEGKFFSDKGYLARRRKLRYLKRCLQGKGTKSSKRHLSKVRRKERNLSKDMVERATNALLSSTDASILVLEDLSKIKSKTSKTSEGYKRVRHNNAQSQVPYYIFKERLTQKAPLVGKQVETVSPMWTSQMDSRTSKRDGQRKGCRYYCSDGVVFDADHNAAVNIANRSKHPTSSVLPIDGKLLPLVGKAQSAALTPTTHKGCGQAHSL